MVVEIIVFYLIIGLIMSIFIYVIADIKHWILFPLLCIAWLPLFLISIILSLFIDVRNISNKINK